MTRTEASLPFIDVPYFSQKEADVFDRYGRKACGFTSTRMVLAHYGFDLGLTKLDQLAQEKRAYTEEAGWIHSGLIDMARSLGLRGFRINYKYLTDEDIRNTAKIFPTEGATQEEIDKFRESVLVAREKGRLGAIDQLIKEGIPVIASMETTYAQTLASHMIVLTGKDEEGRYRVQDPWTFGPDYRISPEDFDQHWTKRAIVIYR